MKTETTAPKHTQGDMHDELVEALKESQYMIFYLYNGSTPRGVKERMDKNIALLKQAEGK